jgi:hypothetical protein
MMEADIAACSDDKLSCAETEARDCIAKEDDRGKDLVIA